MSPTHIPLIPTISSSSPPLPAVSQNLWVETADKKTKTALRAVSDDILYRALGAITAGLPRKIVELSDLVDRSKTDESSIFHPKWDTRWSSPSQSSSPTAIVTGFSLIGMSSTNVAETAGKEPRSASNTTTTRRFSISQQCGPTEFSLPSSVSVYRPPNHIVNLWQVLEGHILQILGFFDLVQVYLILKTPIAEEGNNTGVEIQQQCSRTLTDARRFVVGCESYLKLYHTQRAKLASKCLKYPQLEDYQRALVERDYEECRDCRYLLMRLRVQCVAVVDILHKNFEKVDDPKGLNRGGGTVGMY